MCAGSGRTLSASLPKSDPLGPFLRILLGSEAYSSIEFNFQWKKKPLLRTRTECWVIIESHALSAKREKLYDEWGNPLLIKSWRRLSCSDMPSSQSEYQLALSMPRTAENATGSWPTPRSEDSEQTGPHRGVPDTLTSAAKATWPTPRVTQPSTVHQSKSGGPPQNLRVLAKATWATPNASVNSGGASAKPRIGHTTECHDQLKASGTISSGCLAATESFVERLTNLSMWLMGYTAAYCRHWATASSGRLLRKS